MNKNCIYIITITIIMLSAGTAMGNVALFREDAGPPGGTCQWNQPEVGQKSANIVRGAKGKVFIYNPEVNITLRSESDSRDKISSDSDVLNDNSNVRIHGKPRNELLQPDKDILESPGGKVRIYLPRQAR